MAVERFDHSNAEDGVDFVYVDNEQVPPKYALISFFESGETTLVGPLERDQLDLQLLKSDNPMTAAEFAVYTRPRAYDIEGDSLFVGDTYPGGRERAARNLAGFVLGEER